MLMESVDKAYHHQTYDIEIFSPIPSVYENDFRHLFSELSWFLILHDALTSLICKLILMTEEKKLISTPQIAIIPLYHL